jgi:hypothetical protein
VIYMHAMIIRHFNMMTTVALITTITTNYLANSNGQPPKSSTTPIKQKS